MGILNLADVVEPVGDVAATDLGPHVGQLLGERDLPVLELVDHALGVVADGIEGARDLLVALADRHAGDLFADARYFADAEQFWRLQNTAIAALRVATDHAIANQLITDLDAIVGQGFAALAAGLPAPSQTAR
mgnify:CR=1 FL=1